MYHTYVNTDYRKVAVGISIAMLLATMLFAAMPVAFAANQLCTPGADPHNAGMGGTQTTSFNPGLQEANPKFANPDVAYVDHLVDCPS